MFWIALQATKTMAMGNRLVPIELIRHNAPHSITADAHRDQRTRSQNAVRESGSPRMGASVA